MKYSFATVEDEKQIKQILSASGLEHRDISASQLQHFLKVEDTLVVASHTAVQENARGES